MSLLQLAYEKKFNFFLQSTLKNFYPYSQKTLKALKNKDFFWIKSKLNLLFLSALLAKNGLFSQFFEIFASEPIYRFSAYCEKFLSARTIFIREFGQKEEPSQQLRRPLFTPRNPSVPVNINDASRARVRAVFTPLTHPSYDFPVFVLFFKYHTLSPHRFHDLVEQLSCVFFLPECFAERVCNLNFSIRQMPPDHIRNDRHRRISTPLRTPESQKADPPHRWHTAPGSIRSAVHPLCS